MSSNTIHFFSYKKALDSIIDLKGLNPFRKEYPRVTFKMPNVKRPDQSFTFEYKLKVIARAAEIGNRAAAREFESMIHYWKKKRDVMPKLPQRQRACRTGLAKFPALERTL